MQPVYLDYAATTPMRPEVQEAMSPLLDSAFGNPSSLHRWGRTASAALEEARHVAAATLGAKAGEILFTRGGTESDNLAVLGSCAALRARGHTPTVVITAVEHHAVHAAAERLAERGEATLVKLAVSDDGRVDLDQLRESLGDAPAVVSTMWVNNETGSVLPVPEIAEIVRGGGSVMHTDAVQAFGTLPVDLTEAPVDLLTVTGHKIYGPKGTGLLFVREGVELSPLLHGGGQERALRPGTEDVAGAVGLACAMHLAASERDASAQRLGALRDRLESGVLEALPTTRINGGAGPRAPHISSLGVEGVDGAALLSALDAEGVAASGGSACASGAGGGSHVISALYGENDARATVRLSLGRHTSEADVDQAIRTLTVVVTRLRALQAVS
jgi:cysteine desulfurase